MSGCSDSTSSPASGRCHWLRLLSTSAWVTHATRQGLAASTVRRAYQLLGQGTGRRRGCRHDRAEPLSSSAAAEDRASGDALRPRLRLLGWRTASGPAIGRWCCWVPMAAFGSARWLGFAAGRVDLDQGMVEVVEIVTEVSGLPAFRAAQDPSFGYRRVGLPRVVVEALAEQLARPGSADDLVFVGPQGGDVAAGRLPASHLAAGDQVAGLDGLRIHDLRHTAAAVDCGRGESQGGCRPGWAYLGQLHPGPLRPPLSGCRSGAPGSPGCAACASQAR